MPTRKTFLITGASSGLGLSIALAALRAGHAVVGTARDIARASAGQPDFSAAGGQWLELDVTSPDASGIVSDCVAAHGVDVLINNAGYGLYGALEDMRCVLRLARLLATHPTTNPSCFPQLRPLTDLAATSRCATKWT